MSENWSPEFTAQGPLRKIDLWKVGSLAGCCSLSRRLAGKIPTKVQLVLIVSCCLDPESARTAPYLVTNGHELRSYTQEVADAGASETSGTYDDFLFALKLRESNNDYGAVNGLNFLGAYQFGEAALVDLGYVGLDDDPTDNDFGGGFLGKDGIDSVSDFLSSHDVQDRAVRAWMRLLWSYMEEADLHDHSCRTIGEVFLTPSGMLAAAHLLGAGALLSFVESDGSLDLRDPYGTPLKDYLIEFADFDVPFASCNPRPVSSLALTAR